MSAPKVDAETLALRAPPRPVTRLNRRSIAFVVAILASAVLGATLWSLRSQHGSSRDTPVELHNVERVAHADGLEQLPADYSKLTTPVPASTKPPLLGPPLPGDLGVPILRAEQQAAGSSSSSDPMTLHSDPAADAARVERINRQREAEEAAKAPLFFRASSRTLVASAMATASRNSLPTPLTAGLKTDSASAPGLDSYAARDGEDRKRNFLDHASDPATTSSHALQQPTSPYEVMAGTVIAAALITGLNSDLPGEVLATVTEAVYDTASGRHLLIPQGSRLIGQYDSQVTSGQRRALLVWTRLILPDTTSIALDRLPGVDPSGYAGLEDGVDWHWQRLLAGAALSTLIGVGAELAAPDRGNGQSQVIVATRQSVQDSVNQVGQELTRRGLNIQPTLTVRPGFPLRVIVNKDLVLRPYQPLIFERLAQ